MGIRLIEGPGYHLLVRHQSQPGPQLRCTGLEVWPQLPFLGAVAELACQHQPWEQVPRQRSR